MAQAVGRYQFAHVLVQETLARKLSAARRSRLHREIGGLLEDLYSNEIRLHAAELAHHFAQVEPGVLAGGALIESSASQPGRVWAGIVDVQGINGSGPVAIVKFNLREEVGAALSLTLENIAAFDANTLVDIVTTTTPGQFDGSGLSLLSPIVTFQ